MPTVLADRITEARQLLQRHFGYRDFRSAQRRVVQSVLAGRDALAILPTGGGKSICFQIPALVLGGLTLVISPLISLMQDQVEALRARGFPAALLNSTLSQGVQQAILQQLRGDGLRLLYLSPERLETLSVQLEAWGIRPTLLAVDEAHCIAEWGSDFRPSYRRLRRLRYRLGNPPTIALTGSATPEVRDDIVRSLGLRNPDVHLGSFDRPNLWFGVLAVGDEQDRLRRLLGLLGAEDRMAIVYAPTRNLTEAIGRALLERGYRAAPYHAGLGKALRAGVLERFLNDDVEVMVATCAFGMGIDKPNVRLVVHWSMPPTPESYYQEAGRAGRDGGLARCVLLVRRGDAQVHRRQLEVTFPPPKLLERIWRVPDGRRGVPANVLASADRLAHELHPERGEVDWRPLKLRRRRAEVRIEAMERYAAEPGCRRAALLGYFGERLRRCSGCGHCRTNTSAAPMAPAVRDRLARLRRALAPKRAPWGGAILEPDVLRRLAEHPPSTAAALAQVPGVGVTLAERLGATILQALAAPPGAEAPMEHQPLVSRLMEWRRETAGALGVPPYVVITDGAIHAIARELPRDRGALGRIAGLGPRALTKWGEELLRAIERARASDDLRPGPRVSAGSEAGPSAVR